MSGDGGGATATAAALDALAAALGPRARRGAPLGVRTTYRVGGPAGLLVDVDDEDDLEQLARAMASSGAAGWVPVLVLGKGSNLLVADAGFPGVVVHPGGTLAALRLPVADSTAEPPTVRAGGALGLPVLARRTVDAGWHGLEWAVGVPGSVGGALKMNAGGHGADTASCLVRYRAVDLAGGAAREADPSSLELGYRTSALGDADVVVWASFAVAAGDVEEGKALVSEIVRWRREHQPGGSNAGSVFTNPPGDSAGRLVDAAGLKGFRLGSARVSEKHANFIQADDDGNAADVVALMAHVRRRVAAETGVLLRPEVKLVGFGGDPLGGEGAGAARTASA
ncbi:MAG TPA: UDP-N-acetylmuramate dehydrogenase [Acidimicrobiales bacterium]|nr:UDP-N-acetylmuramate dehydrogenase [Acidimicrobiales bacterium]